MHQIIFEATRGSSVRSDIAIDDIILQGGPCPGHQPRSDYSRGNAAHKSDTSVLPTGVKVKASTVSTNEIQ